MNIYIIIWCILLLSSIIWKKTLSPIIVCWILLVIVEGGRDLEVGVDTTNYLDIFNNVGEGAYMVWVEPLWNLLCFIFYNFVSNNYTFFLLIVAAIILYNHFYVFYKESPYPILSIFIFVSLHMYTAGFNIMRQSLSMSFVFLSWYYMAHNYRMKSYFLLLIAILFHFSNIFALLVILWNRILLTKRKIIYMLVISFLFGSIMNESILSKFIFLFENFLEKDTVFRDNSFVVLLIVIVQNLITYYILSNQERERYNEFWFKLFILSCVVFNATYMIAYAARIYLVFAMSQLIFVPVFLQQIPVKRKFVVYFVFILYMSAQFFRILLSNGNGILPYNNVLI